MLKWLDEERAGDIDGEIEKNASWADDIWRLDRRMGERVPVKKRPVAATC